MGCFPCFDSKEAAHLNPAEGRDDRREEQPMVPPRVEKLSSAFDPNAVPNSNNRSGGERRSRCSDEKGGRMLAKNDDGGSGRKWELDVDKEDSPRETIGILNRDFDRERAVAEAKMWGENWREKIRANANAQGSFDAANGNG
ncbi:putative serine/threonine-protein kinase PBS1 [Cocos nucifera]|uniref:Putative serine/threonine-protein kinase PBS1 n=1 Tax=Cocos nucifera TaxID=13894 RepID=A0A8K0IXA8_COCNU|nr:putative serine/threonine-protein kinase PBS1 [Cocos nucifera]